MRLQQIGYALWWIILAGCAVTVTIIAFQLWNMEP